MRRVLLLLVSLASIPLAAAPLARVAGQVTMDDSPLPGCTVRLQSAAMTRTTVADVEGRYAFQDVAEGEYEIHFELDGAAEPAQGRVLVQGESVVVPVQDLEMGETITLACSAATCDDEPPADRFGLPLCSESFLNDALIESAKKGDASSAELLRSRYETADTYGERNRIASTLLRRTSNDAKFWNELASHAEIAVRFPHVDDELPPEYFAWCAERGIDADEYWNMASHALELSSADPRSHPLLLRALATDDSTLVYAAITGLGKQKDFDSLPLIDKAIARMPDEYRSVMAAHLAWFADERTDAVAMKYLEPQDTQLYQELGAELKQTGGDPR